MNSRVISSEAGFTDDTWLKGPQDGSEPAGAVRLREAIRRVHRVDIEAADQLSLVLLPLLTAVNKILKEDQLAEGLDELDDWLRGRN